jgi:uncharacterized protein YbjT (DUF2867 family)
VELAFSVAESFGIFVSTAFMFGWHQGIRTTPFQMTRSCDRSRPTSTMSGPSPMRFPVEVAVRAAFADAILMRPAVMFGPDDAFLTVILGLLKRLPVYPMFGNGQTRLQPVYVEDVAEAVAMALQPTLARPITFECGGPHVYSYEELLRAVAHEANIRSIPMSVPFAAWRALAWISEFLPRPPITRNQVELMQVDNVSSAQLRGFADLGILPHSIEQILQEILRQVRGAEGPL